MTDTPSDAPGESGRTVHADDGTRLRLHRATPEAPSGEAVLFVHGATYPGRAVFDLPGASWLDACADGGRPAYALDVRGYGDSEAPPELDAPAGDNPPAVRGDVAVGDVACALDHVAARHDRVHLVGYSWGSILCGRLLAERSPAVASLTQLAPVHTFPEGRPDLGGGLDAYRVVSEERVRERWDAHFGDADPATHREPGVAGTFWEVLLESGQGIDSDGTPSVRAPNGTLVDLREAAEEGPRYDAGRITTPTLVVRGSLDATATRADALGLYDALGAAEKEYAELAGGSHFLTLERRREALFDCVEAFHARQD
ncbi:alpha/beta hydrolase [Halomarina litorea]|uniref:alpha/beta hydrolase n=1 Tax=Halomarina litorea TaxID=2961595 RepID=UPI0020C257F1|nr:alpha/beta fold hydrolase [Halomarina sp. BCD28]